MINVGRFKLQVSINCKRIRKGKIRVRGRLLGKRMKGERKEKMKGDLYIGV